MEARLRTESRNGLEPARRGIGERAQRHLGRRLAAKRWANDAAHRTLGRTPVERGPSPRRDRRGTASSGPGRLPNTGLRGRITGDGRIGEGTHVGWPTMGHLAWV